MNYPAASSRGSKENAFTKKQKDLENWTLIISEYW